MQLNMVITEIHQQTQHKLLHDFIRTHLMLSNVINTISTYFENVLRPYDGGPLVFCKCTYINCLCKIGISSCNAIRGGLDSN